MINAKLQSQFSRPHIRHAKLLPRSRRSISTTINAVNVEQLKGAKAKCEELCKKTPCAPILVRFVRGQFLRSAHDHPSAGLNADAIFANDTDRTAYSLAVRSNAGTLMPTAYPNALRVQCSFNPQFSVSIKGMPTCFGSCFCGLNWARAALDIRLGSWERLLQLQETGKGGANGTIRFDDEITAGPNAGLKAAYLMLSPIKKEFPDVSWADLMQMASAVAIETAGGPKIDMQYGRQDAPETDLGDTTGLPAGNNPFPTGDNAAGHLRAVFHRMGLDDKDIVALSGAHTLGRAFKNRSGIHDRESTKYTAEGPGTKGGMSWTPEWLKFDNSYYKEVKEHMDPDLLVMETDDALFKDPEFAPFANEFHDSNDAFFQAYAASHKKLSELGVKWDEGAPVSI